MCELESACRGIRTCQTVVRVYLIAQQPYIVPDAQLAYPVQLLLGPYPAYRIVGITEDHCPDAALELALEALPVDGIVVVLVMQRALDQRPSGILNSCEERVIYRCKCQHLVLGLCQREKREVDACHHACSEEHPFRIRTEMMSSLPPALYSLVGRRQRIGISEHGMLQSLSERLHHLRHRSEVRIGYPVRQHVLMRLEAVEHIPLDACSSSPVDGCIKIKHTQATSFL